MNIPNHSTRKSNRRGFTLIEILLTVSLFSICSLAIYNVFSSGVRIWARAEHFAVEEDVSIFLDKLSEDLRNSFYYTGIKFIGTQSRLTIPTFVTTLADERSFLAQEELVTQIGSVRYYFDYEAHSILRAQANYAQALDVHFPEGKVLVRSVNSLRFIYYMPGGKGVQPYSKINEVIPSGVYVEIKYNDGHSEQMMDRFIAIPTGI